MSLINDHHSLTVRMQIRLYTLPEPLALTLARIRASRSSVLMRTALSTQTTVTMGDSKLPTTQSELWLTKPV